MILHGHARDNARSPTYLSWQAMKNRCSRKSHPHYQHYGGRGITVGVRWRCFQNFLEDMGERPAGMTLDRIDNDGPYCKDNCKWSCSKDQHRNRRNNRRLTYRGRSLCVVEWAEILDVSCYTLFRRLYKGWSIEKTLTTPVRRYSNVK